MLSRQFIERLKLSGIPQYKIALKVGVHPGMLSKWVIGAQPVRFGDKRLIQIGELLGLKPQDIFTNNPQEVVNA